MNGSRFQLAYGIGENLTPEEINKLDLKDKEIKIKDNNEVLPDLIVTDVDAARQYIDYMNITYVAFTRPKYRLYTYGTRFENEENPQQKITNIGQLISSFLYQEKTTNDHKHERKGANENENQYKRNETQGTGNRNRVLQ